MEIGLELPHFSIGVGDRFAHQAKAQLQACLLAEKAGVEVIPVWNKSNREHTIIGSEPSETRAAADAAVLALGWTKPYLRLLYARCRRSDRATGGASGCEGVRGTAS
jgi:hypothetical protein